jgi:hypothetical protein
VCQHDYADNDELRTMPCWHVYHRACIGLFFEHSGASSLAELPLSIIAHLFLSLRVIVVADPWLSLNGCCPECRTLLPP